MARISDLPQLLMARDWAAAERLLRREAVRNDAPASVFYNLAKVLEASDKPEQMERWLTRAILRDGAYQAAWFELGRVQLARQSLREAYKSFERASSLAPEDSDARLNAARLALRLGEWGAAADLWSALDSDEADLARLRIAAEAGENVAALTTALAGRHALRPALLKALTRTARGRLPLKLPEVDSEDQLRT